MLWRGIVWDHLTHCDFDFISSHRQVCSTASKALSSGSPSSCPRLAFATAALDERLVLLPGHMSCIAVS